MTAGVVQRRIARGSGLLILLVGLWGGVVPFLGPLFGYSMGGTQALVWTESRATLHVAPAIAAVAGALLLLGAQRRGQMLGGVLAAVGGVWFVIAPSLHPLWAPVTDSMGGSMTGGSTVSGVLSAIGYHYGTGAVITVLASFAVGLLMSRGETTTPSEVGARGSDSRLSGSTLGDAPRARSTV